MVGRKYSEAVHQVGAVQHGGQHPGLDQGLRAFPERLRAEHLLDPGQRVEPAELRDEQLGGDPDAALRREARARGWEVRDFRSGRKAAKIAVPAAMGTGMVIGAVAATAPRLQTAE